MNIKFLTIILSLALLAQNAKADEQEELAVFGLVLEDGTETLDEIPDAENLTAESENASEEIPDAENLTAESENASEEIPNIEEETPAATENKDADTAEIAHNINDMQKQLEQNQEELSYYIKNLNLQASQLDAAKEISEEGRLRQMQLMQNIEQLQQQVNDLEQKNLAKFKGILSTEQQELFNKLQEVYAKNLQTKEELQKLIHEQEKTAAE